MPPAGGESRRGDPRPPSEPHATKQKHYFCSLLLMREKISQKSLTGGVLLGVCWVFWIFFRFELWNSLFFSRVVNFIFCVFISPLKIDLSSKQTIWTFFSAKFFFLQQSFTFGLPVLTCCVLLRFYFSLQSVDCFGLGCFINPTKTTLLFRINKSQHTHTRRLSAHVQILFHPHFEAVAQVY